MDGWSGKAKSEVLNHYALRCSAQFDLLAGVLKNSAFKEEKEVRCFYVSYSYSEEDFPDNSPLLFRVREGVLVPYMRIPLGSDSDSAFGPIKIGPGLKPHQTMRSFEALKESRGWSHLKFEMTEGAFVP